MAIKFNDNIRINAGKPSESKYLSIYNAAYDSLSAVTATTSTTRIPISERHLGLTVLVDTGTTNIEYWWKEGVYDSDLIEKKFASEQVVGDFITGATNLGYFSGQTGIQELDISGTGFTSNVGNYFSEYNWYYVDSGNVIRIGNPEYGAPFRRTYVNAARTKSWIWSVVDGQWMISDNDVVNNVGNPAILVPHTDYVFTGSTWSGSEGVANASVTAYGSLTTGNTVTVGNPVYDSKSNQELHFKTIINDSPEFLNIEVDDYYVRFSGISSVIGGENIGAGSEIFTGETNNLLGFRTLTPSGDTSISQGADGSLIIYSSSDGSADAITGATNVGVGSGVFSGTTDRELQLRSFVGSGTTNVITSGDTIIIDSYGGSELFTEDITVSIASGKTFGKYENGDVIPASGKTANDVILLSLQEVLAPTLTLGSSGMNIDFGESGKTVNVTFSYTIDTIGATVATAVLEWRRGNSGSYTGLTSDTGDTSYFHVIDDSADRFNTDVINYRYTVVDTEGGTGQTTYDVFPEAYVAPTISPTYTALTLESYETEQLREIGNIDTTIGGGISSNSSLVNLIEYRIQRDDGTGYTTIETVSSINALSITITPLLDAAASSSATTINYRVLVDDEYQTNNVSAVYTITLRYSSYFGYNTSNTGLTSAQIVALGNEALLDSNVRTVTGVSATEFEYTYTSYPASFGDLTTVILNGTAPVLGAFTKLSDVTVTNNYGKTVNNIIYKSNAPLAFTDDELSFL